MHIRVIIIFSLLSWPVSSTVAQGTYEMKGNEKYVEIDFLSSYYAQDGNNAAVTGGLGTEQLTDFANIIVVNVPIDSVRAVNATFGFDNYSSASTDNIDFNVSSASRQDTRAYGNLSYSKKVLAKGLTYSARIGFSSEYDYTSVNGGGTIVKEFNAGNSEVAFLHKLLWISGKPIFLRNYGVKSPSLQEVEMPLMRS